MQISRKFKVQEAPVGISLELLFPDIDEVKSNHTVLSRKDAFALMESLRELLEGVDETDLERVLRREGLIVPNLPGQSQQIQAIKRVRELTGWSLKAAKEFVDQFI